VAAAVRVGRLADPGNTPGSIPGFWAPLCLLTAFLAVLTALGIFGFGVAASLEQQRTRRQLPPRPGPGGHTLDGEQSRGTAHGPFPPGPADGQARTDLRAHKPPQRLPARAARTTRGVRPAPGAV